MEWGPTDLFNPPLTVPSDRPQNVTAVDIGPTSFTLQWSPPPPQYHHGIIQRYNIRVFEGYNSEATDLLTSETTEVTVEGLQPYQLYQCTVAAETVDEGPHSAAVFVTTAEDGEIHVQGCLSLLKCHVGCKCLLYSMVYYFIL